MPIYDYDCAACGRRFEVIHGVHAEGPTTCQLCGGGPVRKAVTAAAVHYRGSGWAKKERRSAAASKPATETAASADGASETASKRGDTPADASEAPAKAAGKAASDKAAPASSSTTD